MRESIDRKLSTQLDKETWDIVISSGSCPNYMNGYCYMDARRKCTEEFCPIKKE